MSMTSPTDTERSTSTADTKIAAGSGTELSTSSEAKSPLLTEHGRTTIADTVVEKVAAVAARQVPGVYRLGSGAARAIGSLRERIPGQRTSIGQGVTVEVGERQAAVDLDIVVEYGYPVAQVAEDVRQNVISGIQDLVGLEVTEVNIAVDDVHLPDEKDDDDESEQETRVQ